MVTGITYTGIMTILKRSKAVQLIISTVGVNDITVSIFLNNGHSDRITKTREEMDIWAKKMSRLYAKGQGPWTVFFDTMSIHSITKMVVLKMIKEGKIDYRIFNGTHQTTGDQDSIEADV
jgi:hypothetical protein